MKNSSIVCYADAYGDGPFVTKFQKGNAMARHARVESSTGIYHAVMRGINKQNIYENTEDFERFKDCLKKVKEESDIKILCYCLMNNHAHIVVRVGVESIGVSFKRIGVRYASWYNRKYNRQGPLFQDRYWSEPIEDDNYLLSAIRYIHQNPIKAGICKDAAEYKWGSYADYLEEGDGLTDTGLVLGIYSRIPSEQRRLFVQFTKKESSDEFIDIDETSCISDAARRERIMSICGVGNFEKFNTLPNDKKKKAIREMRKSGISIRQIVQHTGTSYYIAKGLGK